VSDREREIEDNASGDDRERERDGGRGGARRTPR
jgi:hypothetical protein